MASSADDSVVALKLEGTDHLKAGRIKEAKEAYTRALAAGAKNPSHMSACTPSAATVPSKGPSFFHGWAVAWGGERH